MSTGEKKTSLGITVYQARHSAKALRRLIGRFGESSTIGSLFQKINAALPEKDRIALKGKSKKASKKSAKKSTRKAAAQTAAAE